MCFHPFAKSFDRSTLPCGEYDQQAPRGSHQIGETRADEWGSGRGDRIPQGECAGPTEQPHAGWDKPTLYSLQSSCEVGWTFLRFGLVSSVLHSPHLCLDLQLRSGRLKRRGLWQISIFDFILIQRNKVPFLTPWISSFNAHSHHSLCCLCGLRQGCVVSLTVNWCI